MQEVNNTPAIEEREFTFEDFKRICKRFWEKRRYLLYVFGACFVLGFAAAIFQKPKYQSVCVFVPQTGGSKKSSSISSLASLAGINLGDMSATEDLSPVIYPELLRNINLNKELMRVPLHFKKWKEPVSFYDLATDKKYRKFNPIGTVVKYTIGLPRTILGAIRGKGPELEVKPGSNGKAVSSYTSSEYEVAKALSKCIDLTIDKKQGYLVLSCTSGEALVAAELCQATMDLLQKYITEFKLQHARSTHEYIRERYEETKAEYEASQMALAHFTDANRGLLTATAQVRRDQLLAEYNLAFSMFTEISKQYLQSEMKVKEDTPVLAAVRPVAVPVIKSNSRSKTLMTWCLWGILLSFGSVLGFDWLKKKGINWPRRWE